MNALKRIWQMADNAAQRIGRPGEKLSLAAMQDGFFAIRDVASQALADEPAKVTPTHRHKKRGTEYVLLGIGKMQAENWVTSRHAEGVQCSPVDMREVAIYRSATDPSEIWVRPREEFEDGRFEVIEREGE